jgi:flagellar protein FlhE
MKSLSKLKGMLLPAVIFVAAISSQNVLAGSYASVVNLPVLHAKGFNYKAIFPTVRGPGPGERIKHVTWNWNVHGWPRGMQVFLCHTGSRCLDVSRLRSGATSEFKGLSATQPFHFQFKLAPAGPAPIADEKGRITVTW